MLTHTHTRTHGYAGMLDVFPETHALHRNNDAIAMRKDHSFNQFAQNDTVTDYKPAATRTRIDTAATQTNTMD